MPARLDIDREAVRTLAVAVGVREAARKLNLPEATVKTWSRRQNWLTPAPVPPTVMQPVNPVNPKPADALAAIMAENKLATKHGLSQYTAAAARRLDRAKGELKLSRPAKDIADIMGKVWPEQTQAGSGGIHIGVLTGQVAIQYKPEQG